MNDSRESTVGVDDLTIDRLTIDDLVTATARGDLAAFAALHGRLASWVQSVVQRQLVDPDQSEEVAQEVFLEVWQKAPSFRPDRAGALSWIRVLARRRAIDRVRSSQSSRERDLVAGIRDLPIDYDQVWERIALQADREVLRAALARIPPLQREAVGALYFDGLGDAEAALLLGTTPSAVKSRRSDGIRSLRREYRGLGDERLRA